MLRIFDNPLTVPIDAKTGQVPKELHDAIITVRDSAILIQKYAQKIKPGKKEEEPTDKATWHICYHDEDPLKPCGAKQPIETLLDYTKAKISKVEGDKKKNLLSKIWETITGR
jgi:hypothetical protein